MGMDYIYIIGRKKEKKISKRILRKKYKKVVDNRGQVWYYEQAVARNGLAEEW